MSMYINIYIYIYICTYVCIQPFRYGQDMTQGQFLKVVDVTSNRLTVPLTIVYVGSKQVRRVVALGSSDCMAGLHGHKNIDIWSWSWYLSIPPTGWDLTQSHFNVGTAYKSRCMRGSFKKNTSPCRHSSIGTPSNKSNPAKQVKAWGYAPWLFVCLGLWHINLCRLFNAKSIFYPNKVSKVSDHSRGWPEGSLFDSYYTKV